MKFSVHLPRVDTCHMTLSPGCQEPICPPRLQEGTWRTGKVLTGFLMLDSDEIFRATYY